MNTAPNTIGQSTIGRSYQQSVRVSFETTSRCPLPIEPQLDTQRGMKPGMTWQTLAAHSA